MLQRLLSGLVGGVDGRGDHEQMGLEEWVGIGCWWRCYCEGVWEKLERLLDWEDTHRFGVRGTGIIWGVVSGEERLGLVVRMIVEGGGR